MREPYIGQVPLVSGEIAEDITNYFAISEQTPTVCALGVLVNPDLTMQCAGGFIVQLMPGATEDEITRLEKNIGAMPGITTLLQQGKKYSRYPEYGAGRLYPRTAGFHPH